MKIGNRIMDKQETTRMGQSQNATDQAKTNATATTPETTAAVKQDSLELSAAGKAQVAAETTTQSSVTATTTNQTGAVASSFGTTSEYLTYLTDTYPSITNSNIEISDTVLKQAMSDPAKEKVLTDFLEGIDGAKDYRYNEIAGMSDDTYTYELKSFGIQLDSIADDNSGINGMEFGEIIVARNDGQRMSDDEFANVKSNLLEQIQAMTDEQNEHLVKLFEVVLDNRDERRVEKDHKEPEETERLEDIVNEQIDERRQKIREDLRKEMLEKMNEDLRQTMHGQNYAAKI